MQLGPYQLRTPLGAGTDGLAYRARDTRDGGPVEVWLLEGARADADRWPARNKRLRQAALLQHPAALTIRELCLEEAPPYLALEWTGEATLAGKDLFREPLPLDRVLADMGSLASALAEAHALGLIHGRLTPDRIRAATGRRFLIDFCRLDVNPSADVLPAGIVASFQAPECLDGEGIEPAADVYSLGALLAWLLTGEAVPPADRLKSGIDRMPILDPLPPNQRDAFRAWLADLLASDPDARPSAREAEQRLTLFRNRLGANASVEALTREVAAVGLVSNASDRLPGERLGRFQLREKLGQGGMGAVYRAEDVTDGTVVAIKVIRPELAEQPQALKRLQKEARLLARVNNPCVANLLEINEDQGVHYLAIEFVPGQNVGSLLEERGCFDEPTALAILADVARALLDAHEIGIVHRDIKPDNIILVGAPAAEGTPPRAKLLDFGLARQVEQSVSQQLTRTGDAIGTPLYMAPEQCTGQGTIRPSADVYAMGATLFHLLAGRPPFVGADAVGTLLMHCSDPVPSLARFNPRVSDGVCRIVEKALAKSPEARYPDAAALLHDLQRLARGEPTRLAIHPRLPTGDPRRTWQFDWTWELESSPAQLWPHVSDTERLNRAVGLPGVQFTSQVDTRRGVRRYGRFRKAGLINAWQEHPFEWIEGRRMGVLREYHQGVFKWLVSIVELAPRAGGGTTLTHRVRLEPRGLFGQIVAAIEVGIKGRRSVERVYHRIDAALAGKLTGGATVDAFEKPARLSGAARRRLERLLGELGTCGVDPAVSERLGDFLAEAPPQEVARIRPLALARRLALAPDQFVEACLYAAQKGLLILLWDILCPVCRIPTQVTDTLKALREHGHCEACNLDFNLDFANSVEMIFRVHPEIRASDLRTYCIGGPIHSPHVVSQARLAPGECLEMDLNLTEGAYRFRGPQLPYAIDFRVSPRGGASRWDLRLPRPPEAELPRVLRAGTQLLALTNDHDQELVVRVERTAPRADALTAGRAWSLALFRQLYPGEILASGQLISVATMTLLTTHLEAIGELYREWGDVRAAALVHEHFRLLEEHIRQEGGALVKTSNAGLLAVFHETASAVGAALEMQPLLRRTPATRALRLGVGVHRGPAVAATLNDRLDYLGSVVDLSMELARHASEGEVLLSQTVAADPQVAILSRRQRLRGEPRTVNLPGWPDFPVHRLLVESGEVGPPPPAPPREIVPLARDAVERQTR